MDRSLQENKDGIFFARMRYLNAVAIGAHFEVFTHTFFIVLEHFKQV